MADMERLRVIMGTMEVPPQKAQAATDTDIQWLGRNLGLRNAAHPDMEEARDLLEGAGAKLVV